MEEIWKKAVSTTFPDYVLDLAVSNTGRVRKIPTGLIYKTQIKDGLMYVERNGKRLFLHHLIAETFLGPRRDGKRINYKDGNRSNNTLSNIEYVDTTTPMAEPTTKSVEERLADLERKYEALIARFNPTP